MRIREDNTVWVQREEGEPEISWADMRSRNPGILNLAVAAIQVPELKKLYISRGTGFVPIEGTDDVIAVSPDDTFWVGKKDSGSYATRWADYAATHNLRLQPILTSPDQRILSALAQRAPIPVKILRGVAFYHNRFLGDDVIAVSGDGSFWVGKKDSGHYVTPWAEYAAAHHLRYQPVIVDKVEDTK